MTTLYDINRFAIERLERYQSKPNGLYVSIAHNTIEALILDGLLYIEENSIYKTNENFEFIDKVNKFRVMLQNDYKKQKSVQYYADRLYISARKLTEMVEKVTGYTAKQLIIEKVLRESVKLLKYSTRTIAEIAFELEFSDEANFSHFIKKNLKKTPREIRMESNEFK